MSGELLAQVVADVGDALSQAARDYRLTLPTRQVGRVLRVADGVMAVAGLPDAALDEMVSIEGAGLGLVLGVSAEWLSVVCLDEPQRVRVGATVHRTGHQVSIAAGPALLGRVVDALGRPLDDQPPIEAQTRMPLERTAPRIHERAAVHRPLHTGVLAVDAMVPIGCGQRELIVGDHGTGKTSLALEVLCAPRDSDIVGVYVAIGTRRSELRQIVQLLQERAGRWVVVAAPEDESPGLRYLAPYAGTAVAEYFSLRGEHALVVYDDLSAHAMAWRELSLLMQRPPGREAYPGDVFYLHARLLERAGQLSGERGGGSLTALPIAVLESGRLTGYIPTNLISITDGQIVLSSQLFAAGQKPAIDTGLSVSRIGAKAQPPVLRSLSGTLRLRYASFLELEAFSRLGTRVDEQTGRRIRAGQRIRRLLRAPRLRMLDLFDEALRLVLVDAADALLLPLDESAVVAAVDDATERAKRALGDVANRVRRSGMLSAADLERVRLFLESALSAHFPPAQPAAEAP